MKLSRCCSCVSNRRNESDLHPLVAILGVHFRTKALRYLFLLVRKTRVFKYRRGWLYGITRYYTPEDFRMRNPHRLPRDNFLRDKDGTGKHGTASCDWNSSCNPAARPDMNPTIAALMALALLPAPGERQQKEGRRKRLQSRTMGKGYLPSFCWPLLLPHFCRLLAITRDSTTPSRLVCSRGGPAAHHAIVALSHIRSSHFVSAINNTTRRCETKDGGSHFRVKGCVTTTTTVTSIRRHASCVSTRTNVVGNPGEGEKMQRFLVPRKSQWPVAISAPAAKFSAAGTSPLRRFGSTFSTGSQEQELHT
ncbi:unnamed protein product [Notodromas monacha]|uniref:Uncharacterized protein n=1 Tax=Notodromas monacha TaxID=399045 RepID=A0A7R9BID5_9CRUS|nr:unnamed protein product [Notodromas monacha]CAG0914644.1 unnamed protein product [Notodromas monacha]